MKQTNMCFEKLRLKRLMTVAGGNEKKTFGRTNDNESIPTLLVKFN